MKTNLLFGLLWLISLPGCQPDPVAPNEDVPALYERFNSRYKPVQAIADQEIDVNLDGKASTDLIRETPGLASTYLQINIIGKNQHVPEDEFLFTQFWPEQYLSLPGKPIIGPTDYDPNIIVNYAEQAGAGRCHFNRQLTQITLDPPKNLPLDPIRWGLPESVKIVGSQSIEVVNQRQLYTRTGWKTVRITTLYERYQKTT